MPYGRLCAAKHNVPVRIYHATSHAQGRLLLLDSAPVAPGGTAPGGCTVPVATTREDRRPRVVFRNHDLGCTLGGGRVVDLAVPRTRRRSERRRERLRGIARRSRQLAGAPGQLGTSLRRGIPVPGTEGITRDDVAGYDLARGLVLDQLVTEGTVRLASGLDAAASHRATLPDDVARLFNAVEAMLDSASRRAWATSPNG